MFSSNFSLFILFSLQTVLSPLFSFCHFVSYHLPHKTTFKKILYGEFAARGSIYSRLTQTSTVT